MKLGISVFFDPTVGTIRSDFLFLNGLVKAFGSDVDVTFVSLMRRTQALVDSYAGELKFKYRILPEEETGDFDAIVTWNNTNLCNFFGGHVSATYLRQYLFLAKHSAKGVPIYLRCGDSENEVHDYRCSIEQRVKKEREKGSHTFVSKNAWALEQLARAPSINYDNFYLLANGEVDKFDWVTDTYRKRLKNAHQHFTDKTAKNAVYLGDEICFQVMERKQEFAKAKKLKVKDHLYWIGFIEYRNAGRKSVFTKLFDSKPSFPMTIQTPTEDFKLPGVKVVNERIVGDTVEYFQHLGKALGYVFIGKGTDRCAYVNKTVYDCFVAGTPVLVYQPTDQGKMIFPELPDCYFSSRAELQSLYQKLRVPEYRAALVYRQAQALAKRLSSVPPGIKKIRQLHRGFS